MGAKDLYLLQIVQYSSNDTAESPSQWAFFVHYTDKSGNPTGEGETLGIELTPNGPKYFQRRGRFITLRFRGACTLGLFYKRSLYRILEELEAGKVGVRKPKKVGGCVGDGVGVGVEAELASLPRVWVEDRLEALRRGGMVLLGPSLDEMMRKAYQAWLTHAKEINHAAAVHTTTPTHANTTSSGSQGDLRWGGTGSGDLIKRYYSYPFVHYATP